MSRACCASMPATRPRHGYAATQAALWNLHRVMAIKDEVYVAWLLSSEEKIERDRDRYNVRPELGDRHHPPPSQPARIHLRQTHPPLQAQDPALDAAPHAPGEIPAPACSPPGTPGNALSATGISSSPTNSTPPPTAPSYATWLKILRLPEEATGYREIRYPKDGPGPNPRRRIAQLARSDRSGGL